jgi:cytochrome c peroxidase
MFFLTRYALPLEERLGIFIRKNGWDISSVPHLDYRSKNLFNGELIASNPKPARALYLLCKKLFFDKELSGNGKRSCASCHQPEKYFTDQLALSRSVNLDSFLSRNTPTLLYAAYQSGQFWDGRAPSLSAQVREVLTGPTEMNASIPVLEKKLTNNPLYHRAFQKEFDTPRSCNPVTMERIQAALAAYVGSLAPMNSSFDRYMAGDHSAMNTEQIKGFNLFMGKGLCGTCHFAPLFNGSTPPFFSRSEYEVLGITGSDEAVQVKLDDDPGRYRLYPVDIYRNAFKTPTVRNTSRTAPYMHNGRFRTLRRVIDFYNKGGGRGLGINVPQQTLPDKPLHLTVPEINAIITFMNSLTDDLHGYAKRE